MRRLQKRFNPFNMHNFHLDDDNETESDKAKLSIFYSIPGRFAFKRSSARSDVEERIDEDKGHYYFKFDNILSPESCEIDVVIKNTTTIDLLKIDCFAVCFIMLTSNKISFKNVEIV
jgi:hypothetical protein